MDRDSSGAVDITKLNAWAAKLPIGRSEEELLMVFESGNSSFSQDGLVRVLRPVDLYRLVARDDALAHELDVQVSQGLVYQIGVAYHVCVFGLLELVARREA